MDPSGGTTQPSLPTTEHHDLRTKFRSIIEVTRMVATINRGHATVRKSSRRNKTVEDNLSSSRPLNEILLSATANILVRHPAEVLAVTASGDSLFAVQGQIGETTAGEPSPATQEQLVSASAAALISDGLGDLTSRIASIAAIVNPKKEHNHEFPDDTHSMVLDNGQSHYKLVQDDDQAWASFLVIPEDDPLSNHVCTVVDYLKTHKRVRQELRWGHQEYFSKYLVARCWPKMRARINCWSSQGYICMLGRIGNEELRNEVSINSHQISAESIDRNDRELAMTVTEMAENGQMKSLSEWSGCLNGWDFTSLVTSFNRMKNVQPHEDDGVYDVATCFAFHQLLIVTLLAYGKALGALQKAGEKSQRNIGDLVTKCGPVWLCGSLLSKIASSRMLRQHLVACKPFLRIPTFDGSDAYRRYTRFPVVDDSSSLVGDPNSAVEDIDVEGDESLNKVFLQWVRLQAGYWLDLAALSRTFGSPDPGQQVPEIFLLAVKHPESGINPLLVESLKTTLNDLVGHNSHHPFDINKALAIIREKSGTVDLRKYIGPIHCEIIMAALVILADDPLAADTIKYAALDKLIQGMDENFIVVSKRCCPICWELLDILRGETKRFRVRGRHATLFPVELPEWLSPRVVDEMIIRFQEILYDEILRMLQFESSDNRPPSWKSISNLSTGNHADEAPLQTDQVRRNNFKAQLGDKGNLFNEPDKELHDSSESLAKDKAGQATSISPAPADSSST